MFPEKYDAIRKILQERLFNNWSKTRIQFSNVKLNPAPVASENWISLFIAFGSENHCAYVDSKTVFRGTGVFQIDIYTVLGTGTGLLNRYARELNDVFINYRNKTLLIKAATYTEIGADSQWYKGVLSFSFIWEYLN